MRPMTSVDPGLRDSNENLKRSLSRGSLKEILSPGHQSINDYNYIRPSTEKPKNNLAKSATLEPGSFKKQLDMGNGLKNNRQSMDFGVTGEAMTVNDFEPTRTVSTVNFTKSHPINNSRYKRGRAQSACNIKPFDTIGDQYWVPVSDHKYRINATIVMGDKNR